MSHDSEMVLTVLYGTQTGCAERTAMTLCALARRHGVLGLRCLPADDVPLESWASLSPLVVVTSNANQGEAPDSIRLSWSRLLQSDAPSLDRLRFAVFGVGDSLYRKFNYMAKMLHNRLLQLGGVAVVHRGLGDESDAKGIDEVFIPWAAQLFTALGLHNGNNTNNDNSHTQSIGNWYSLEEAIIPLTRFCVALSSRSKEGEHDEDEGDEKGYGSVVDAVPRVERTFDSTVTCNTRLTAPEHFQAVHEITLSRTVRYPNDGDRKAEELSLAYEVGDALGVYCPNSTAQVEAFLRHMDLDGAAVVTVTPNPTEGLLAQRREPFFHQPMPLREFVRHYVDLEAVVSRPLLAMMSTYATDDEVRERLAELAAPAHLDEYITYAHREKRNVVELLDDFRGVRPPLALLLSLVEPMRARLFSIASSPLGDAAVLTLTVARLEWRTPYGRTREGMCSAFLTASASGDVLRCHLWHGALHTPRAAAPMVCVATGTGVAPLRALLRECAAIGGEWTETPVMLFFGCRGEERDFIYAREWEELAQHQLRGLRVVTAFSRDGPKKVYVQHRMGEQARRIATLLNDGAYVYVCGNAKQMPKDVNAVLQDIMTQCCCDSDEVMGQQYMRRLEKERRLVLDTWSA